MQKILNRIIWLICIIVVICPIVQLIMLNLKVDVAILEQFAPNYFIFGSFLFLVALFAYGLINIIVHKILGMIQKRNHDISEYICMCGCAIIVYIMWVIVAIKEGW